jgi:hypothetical protein
VKQKLEALFDKLDDLRQTVKLPGNVIESKPLNTEEATALLKMITDYSHALDFGGKSSDFGPHPPPQISFKST